MAFIGQLGPLTSLTPGERNKVYSQCRPHGEFFLPGSCLVLHGHTSRRSGPALAAGRAGNVRLQARTFVSLAVWRIPGTHRLMGASPVKSTLLEQCGMRATEGLAAAMAGNRIALGLFHGTFLLALEGKDPVVDTSGD